MSRCYSSLPFNSCRTPPSTELCPQDQRDASLRSWPVAGQQRAADLNLLPASFFKLHGVSWVEPAFWTLSHFLNTSANSVRVRKGSAHIFKGTQAWQALLGCHRCDGDVSAPAFPLFLKLLYSAFYCVWWGTLKGSCSEVILEDGIHTAMLFPTPALQL